MGTRALSVDPWTHLTSDGVIDACDLAELVSGRYAVTYVSSLALVGGDLADRYVALDLVGDALIATLWTDEGGRRGHAVTFALAEYNYPAGADELEAELTRLFTRWRIASRQPGLARRPAAA